MINEAFATSNSVIHRLDPRLKIIYAIFFSILVALCNRFEALFFGLTVTVCLILLARLDKKIVFKRLLMVNGLIFFFWLFVPLTFDGEPIFMLGPFSFSRPGVLLACRFTLKTNTIIMLLIAFMSSMPVYTLGHAMGMLKIHPKLIFLFLMTYRYIFIIQQEYRRLARSAKIRGFNPSTNIHTYKTYAYIIGMLFIRASERAERVHNAMLCRGFKGRFYSLNEYFSTPLDWSISFILFITLTGIIILEWSQLI